MSRHSGRQGGSKKSYKWCGTGQTRVVETAVSTTTAELLILCPVVSIAAYNNVIIERTIINFSIRRDTAGDILALAAMVCVQPVATGTALPVQSLDALDTSDAAYGAGNILHWEALPVPALVYDSTGDTMRVDGSVDHVQWDIPVKRKLNRERECLVLTINSDVSSVVKVFMQSRVLLLYGRK